MAYPGYPAQPAQPQADPLWGYFSAVAGQDGQIDADELQRALTSSGIAGSYQPFNRSTCVIMITMLDRDRSGQMGFNEFKELWTALNQWKETFMRFDGDRSGTIEGHELQQAISSFGFNLSPQAIAVILRRYGVQGRVKFDDFVALCVRLRALTAQFQQRDTARNGTAMFQFDDFIQTVMGL